MGFFSKPPAPRQVRLHLQVHSPIEAHDGTMTIEGFMTGRQPVAGHYMLDRAKILEHRLHADHRRLFVRSVSTAEPRSPSAA